ncbi:MAG: efflux RND transporter permease subunit [Sandaracinaceae bacterium]
MSGGLLPRLTERPRLTLGLALLLSGAGVAAWFTMPREEDPTLAERFGLVLAPFPGADAEQVERLVVDPLEEELSEVEQVQEVRTTVRSGIAILNVELRREVTDTDPAWDRVEDALEDAYGDLPAAALEPSLDHDLNDTEAVLLALTGPHDVLALADAADALRRRLLTLGNVSRVDVTGDPGEQIPVAFHEATARRLGIPPEGVARMLSARNVSVPAGDLRVGSRRLEIRPGSELETIDEIATTPVLLRDGSAVPLAAVADVRRMPAEPVAERARVDGETTVVLGVVPRRGIDTVAFGGEVRKVVDDFRAARDDIRIEEVAYQPAKVAGRLGELGVSLLIGIGIVALVVIGTMGFRLGVIVSSVVPLVTFASLAVYALGGGVLHQMAVAAMVIALGLLVDNAIVVAEAIQRRIDEGEPRPAAVKGAVRELAIPLASATGTTLAAFVPMLLAPGTTGDFTRAIPVMVMLTLAVSYLYALAVTPALSGLLLRPTRAGPSGLVDRLAHRIGAFAVQRPWLALLAVLLVVGTSGAFAMGVRFNFFPSSDREQLVVSVELPEGTHLDATDEAARVLEAALRQRPEVRSVAAFVGRSTPRFYYNLPNLPRAPNLAQLIVTTRGPKDVLRLQGFVRQVGARRLPDAIVVPRRLEQGPPVPAPVEVRLFGEDLAALHQASELVRTALRDIPEAIDVRANHGPGAPLLAYRVDDADAGRRGVARVQVATAMFGRIRGLPAGDYRGGDDPVPIRVRAPAGEDHAPADLDAVRLVADDGRAVPLGRLTTPTLTFGPAVVHHHQGRRVVSVFTEVADHATHEQVVAALSPRLAELDLPDGVTWEYGGAVESSAEANAALGTYGGLGALLLVSILLAQFNSLRRVLIVLVTAPLAILGIWPGRWLGDLPFGFVALLGAIALLGIVVNGAIVLLDRAETLRSEGRTVAEAVERAVEQRTRPILLTTVTTVAGLTPLLFSASTLWPPMAAAMISGLTVATALTLLAVPALYRLLFRDPKAEPAPAGSPQPVGAA